MTKAPAQSIDMSLYEDDSVSLYEDVVTPYEDTRSWLARLEDEVMNLVRFVWLLSIVLGSIGFILYVALMVFFRLFP